MCREVLTLVALQGWQIGTTRVFLRAGQLAALEVCFACSFPWTPPWSSKHATHHRKQLQDCCLLAGMPIETKCKQNR